MADPRSHGSDYAPSSSSVSQTSGETRFFSGDEELESLEASHESSENKTTEDQYFSRSRQGIHMYRKILSLRFAKSLLF